MLLSLAWRNVWRNRVRSLVIISSIALGLWGGIFMISLTIGLSNQRKINLIKSTISHVQVHHPKFPANREIQYPIPNGKEVLEYASGLEFVESATARTVTFGMVSSAAGGSGVMISGIIPDKEQNVTNIHDKLIEGDFFQEESRIPQIVIGQKLADKLKLKLGSKHTVLTYSDTTSDIVYASFKVGGIFKTSSTKFDEAFVYVTSEALNEAMETEGLFHEIAIVSPDEEYADTISASLKSKFPDLLVETWYELSPEIQYLDEAMDLFLYIFVGIILFALSFGLINTMLMAVLERTRELGMLMAIGMNKFRVFVMIQLETIYMAITGGVLGLGMAVATIELFKRKGLDLSIVEQGLSEFGYDTMIYPAMNTDYLIGLSTMIVIFAVISAIYPAIKALRLRPVVALRKI